MEISWVIRDPFAGHIDVTGETLQEAVDEAYADLDPAERPTYVWHEGQQIFVYGGMAAPL